MSMVFPTPMRMVDLTGWTPVVQVERKKAIFQKCSCTDFLQKLAYNMQIKVTLVTPAGSCNLIPSYAAVTFSFNEDIQSGLSIKYTAVDSYCCTNYTKTKKKLSKRVLNQLFMYSL